MTDGCQRPSTHVSSHWKASVFVREVEGQACLTTSRPDARRWSGAHYWKLLVGLNQNLGFPTEIVSTNLQPDVALWAALIRHVYIIELTVPWENSVGEAYDFKKLWYMEMADAH